MAETPLEHRMRFKKNQHKELIISAIRHEAKSIQERDQSRQLNDIFTELAKKYRLSYQDFRGDTLFDNYI